MGRSRTVLNKIVQLHEEFVVEYHKNTSDLLKLKLEKNFLNEIKNLVQEHINVLKKPDFFRRKQSQENIENSQYKLKKFEDIVKNIEDISERISEKNTNSYGIVYTCINDLFNNKINKLIKDKEIDNPRFPRLPGYNFITFFKSMMPFYSDKSSVNHKEKTKNTINNKFSR